MQWNLFKAHKGSGYCAFCRSRKIFYSKKSLGVFDIIILSGLAITIMYLALQSFDPRVVIFFVLALISAETMIHFRWRLSLVCQQCGFDPILYKRAPEKAALKVKARLDLRKENEEALFSAPLNIPTRKIKKEASLGGKLSRHV